MDLKVKIISRETIRPSSSATSNHPKTHNLSLLDQLAPPIYIPILLFYSSLSSSNENPRKRSDHLKKSLSKTLAHFYPFAGRVKDAFTIDCNDHGATFIESEIAVDMSVVLKDPTIDMLLQLMPCDPLEKLPELSLQAILVIQANYFACGGMSICVCIRHVVADASAAASFVKTWASVACGGVDNFGGLIYDCTSLFPPQEVSVLWKTIDKCQDVVRPKVVTKRFVFDGSKIADLRNKISDGKCLYRPTRVEAVSALIWSAFITSALSSADQKDDDESGTIPNTPVSMHVATIAVNLRGRLNPALPQLCIGNAYQSITACSVKETVTSLGNLAGKVHESILKMNDEYVKKTHAGGAYMNAVREAAQALGKSSKVGTFNFSSWCKFPFYETDFGWGRPVWFGTALGLNRVAILLDTSDGRGIEAWIGLRKEEMAELEKNPELLAYASF